jgi:hypothetical protein
MNKEKKISPRKNMKRFKTQILIAPLNNLKEEISLLQNKH